MKKRILLILLAGVMLMAMLAMTFTACGPTEPETPPVDTNPPGGETTKQETVIIPGITPDYPVPEEDENVEDSVDDEDKMQVPQGSTGAGMEYATDVVIDIANNNVNLYFRNPSRSLQNMAVQLVIQDQVLAESGLIVPGKQLGAMPLKHGVTIAAGVYEQNAKLVVRYYDPTTNVCSVLTSEILVKVTAQ